MHMLKHGGMITNKLALFTRYADLHLTAFGWYMNNEYQYRMF
jgi:hypothetical protein